MSTDVASRPTSTRRLLTGWGRHAGSVAEVARPRSQAEVVALLGELPERGGLARGYGRGYGDCAQDAGGLVLDMTGLAPDLSIDVENATVTASAGISIDTLIETLVPLGFFVPVTPGTRTVSVGGALAADVHGKNHHVDGSFGTAVTSLDLVLPGGEVRRLAPDGDDPEAFWATIGGMGLTGVITSATFSVIPIESSRCVVDTERAADLDEALDLMISGDDDYRYTVSWIDLMARGSSMGRSVLTRGDFATLDQLDGKAARKPLAYRSKVIAAAPPWSPPMVNRLTISAFNEMWFRKAPKLRRGEIQGLQKFFHPLDMLSGWNRLYGSPGFVQYQFVLPYGEEETLRTVVGKLSQSGIVTFLTVLKRFGPGNPGFLSFPKPGWTLAMDFPLGQDQLATLLPQLDELVVGAGGRHYFAKDSVTTPDMIRRGYPRLDEWRAVRDRLDPGRRMISDLARRLQLIED
jgi:decaprenylphospho-beta-D-ribofuranose 2-oxidase